MRRFIVGLVAAAMTAAAFVGAAPPAGALIVGDVAVGLIGRPAKVSPPGGYAMYTASATNEGLVAIDVVLTDSSSIGTVVKVSRSECGFSGGTATCSITQLQPGQTFSVDVIVKTPTTAGTLTNTVSATSNLDVDVEPQDNSASTSTPVVNDPAVTMAFVPGGDCITYKTHTLCVPSSSPGVFVVLNDAIVAPNTDCGGGAVCGNGVHLDFVQDDTYKAQDPNDPLRFSVAFPNEDPCHGGGNLSCVGISYRTQGFGPAARIAFCQGASYNVEGNGSAVPSPCVNKITKNGGQGKFAYDVRLLSNDPDILPPVRL